MHGMVKDERGGAWPRHVGGCGLTVRSLVQSVLPLLPLRRARYASPVVLGVPRVLERVDGAEEGHLGKQVSGDGSHAFCFSSWRTNAVLYVALQLCDFVPWVSRRVGAGP